MEGEQEEKCDDNNSQLGEKLYEYDPKELKASCDGWELFKKSKFNYQPVRKYLNQLVTSDYTKNKITVCAHLSNLFNTFQVSRLYNPKTQGMEKTSVYLNNYFDYEKWQSIYDPIAESNEGGMNSPLKTKTTGSRLLRQTSALQGPEAQQQEKN